MAHHVDETKLQEFRSFIETTPLTPEEQKYFVKRLEEKGLDNEFQHDLHEALRGLGHEGLGENFFNPHFEAMLDAEKAEYEIEKIDEKLRPAFEAAAEKLDTLRDQIDEEVRLLTLEYRAYTEVPEKMKELEEKKQAILQKHMAELKQYETIEDNYYKTFFQESEKVYRKYGYIVDEQTEDHPQKQS